MAASYSDIAIREYRAWMERNLSKYYECAREFETGGLDALVRCLKERVKRAKTVEDVVGKYARKIKRTAT